MNHYPHHIGDFDKATRHLTRIERSIYRDLIELYYDTETQLTLDISALCRRILARTNEEVTAVEQTLNEFFNETPIGWFHSRCETEIEKYRANASQKAQAGKASAAAKLLKAQQAATAVEHPLNERATAVEHPNNGVSTNRKPLTVNQEPIKKPSAEYSAEFLKFWESWPTSPRKGGRPGCYKIWKARNFDADCETIIAHVESQKNGSSWKDTQYIPAPSVYLGQARWDGAETQQSGGNDSFLRRIGAIPA